MWQCFAQPVVDGVSTGDSQYMTLATWTQGTGQTGFGDFGMMELDGYTDATNLYVLIKGVCENNYNEFFLLIHNTNSSNSLAAGTQLPAGSDNGSPFFNFKPTLDFDVDFGLRLTTGGTPNTGYISIIDYRNSGNTDTYLGSVSDDGTKTTVSGGTYDQTQLAYKFANNLTTYSGIEGFEIAIPLASLVASQGDNFEFFALYGNDDYMSANTLPEIAGQGGTSLGSNPDFSLIAGDQHTTASPLPVELTSFTGAVNNKSVELKWSTATELNNHGFEIQRLSSSKQNSGEGWEKIGFVEGNGTANSPKQYSFVDNSLSVGKYSYRLKQIDLSGSYEYSKIVEINFGLPTKFSIDQNYPNPFNPSTIISYALPEASNVKLIVYNSLGQEVSTLINSTQDAGVHNINFNASNLTSGLYFYRIEAGNFTQVKKMILLK